jgi:uncharacterized protein YgiM (DUF1202 family)
MNTHGRWSLAVLLVTATLGAAGATDQKAITTADRVNVRGQATLNSEIVTQLREGEEVVVLEEIPVRNPQAGEPAVWARIQLPASTPVWVFAPYIDSSGGVVNVSRLNLRAGPGENYSVLGRIERGVVVKQIRVEKNWMEIEAPDSAHAYVAANFLKRLPAEDTTPGTATQPVAESAPPTTTPAQTPGTDVASPATTEAAAPVEATPETAATTQPVEIEPAPAAPVDQAATSVAPETGTTPPTTLPAEEATVPEVLPRRVVSREGRVIISRSIQAPTDYALESLDTRRTINYLHSEDLGVNLKVYAGRKVIVTGEELMDQRWTRTPIVEVESIRLVP